MRLDISTRSIATVSMDHVLADSLTVRLLPWKYRAPRMGIGSHMLRTEDDPAYRTAACKLWGIPHRFSHIMEISLDTETMEVEVRAAFHELDDRGFPVVKGEPIDPALIEDAPNPHAKMMWEKYGRWTEEAPTYFETQTFPVPEWMVEDVRMYAEERRCADLRARNEKMNRNHLLRATYPWEGDISD